MLRFSKMLLVAGMLVAAFAATAFVGASKAEAGGYGYYGGYYHSYYPTYRVYKHYYYTPSYHCYPSYGYGY